MTHAVFQYSGYLARSVAKIPGGCKMMTNRQIAKTFQLLAKMMELHGEGAFRVRAYSSAYDAVKRMDRPVAELSAVDLASIKGIGASTSEKIMELINTGRMERFDQFAKKTPEGIRDLLMIKGLGPAKVKTIWKVMGITSPGELLYACHENRLVEYSGFGLKTQAEIRKQLEYHFESQGKFLWAVLEPEAIRILESLRTTLHVQVDWVGEFARGCPVVETLECIASGEVTGDQIATCHHVEVQSLRPPFACLADDKYRFVLHPVATGDYERRKLELTAHPGFLSAWDALPSKDVDPMELPPELLEHVPSIELIMTGAYRDLVKMADVHGIIHCHTTYSDGLHTLREMAEYTRDAGFTYLGVTEHSRSAVYARGLHVERVLAQWEEIDQLNAELAPFHIFKGIESDILADGKLDYDDEMLAGFDFVIASVHSTFQMDKEKATARLIRAIEHPATRILGHPTGRLLLARQGYPLDHHKVIDACARNHVAIELNANPQRLDIESAYISYAMDKGVMIAVNPDAHSRESIHNVRHGIREGRRGGLVRSMCLNTLSTEEFAQWIRR